MIHHKKEPCIYGETLKILKQLLRDGYIYTGKNRNHLRYLQKIFPEIRRSQFKNKSIYYLKDKNKQAFKEMMKQDKSRIITFQELGRMSQVFNANVDIKHKKAFIGRNRAKKPLKNCFSKDGSLRENGGSLVDFCIRKY